MSPLKARRLRYPNRPVADVTLGTTNCGAIPSTFDCDLGYSMGYAAGDGSRMGLVLELGLLLTIWAIVCFTAINLYHSWSN